ncbi:MAG: ribonuclease HII [archaeon]|nr:ribonuclease HII [archaeon]
MKKIMGIDEAGRGPVLGDLFIGGVICTQEQINYLKNNGVDDSKKLSSKKRKILYKIVEKNCLEYKVDTITVKTIDNNIKQPGKKSLNVLEKELMADLIISLQPDEVFIDAIGSKPEKFEEEMKLLIKKKMKKMPKIIAKNKGDSLFTIVGAASIMAKVQRDDMIDKYKEEYAEFGDIGSGYTSDAKTIGFLRKYIIKHKNPPKIARKSWETTKKLIKELVTQQKLTDFF